MTHCVVTPIALVNVKESIPGNISRRKSPMGQSPEEARLLGEVPGKKFLPPSTECGNIWDVVSQSLTLLVGAGESLRPLCFVCSKVLELRKKAGVLTHPVPKGFKSCEPFLSGYNKNAPNIQSPRCQPMANLVGHHLRIPIS